MTDGVVVDTCVMEHLFNREWNGDGHIDRLLEKIARKGKRICMDAPVGNGKGRMLQEYEHRLQHHWERAAERGQLLQWLRYIVYLGERQLADVNLRDGLGSCVVPHLNRVRAERS